jgi:leucyl-tRNA synthetase
VVDPGTMLERYGADALRLYVCFMGPYEATLPWNENGLKACRRLVETVMSLHEKVDRSGEFKQDEKILGMYHKLVKKVGDMLDSLKMNTAVSEFMIFTNEAKKVDRLELSLWKGFLKALAPFAVFTTEELWQDINGCLKWEGRTASIFKAGQNMIRR